MGADVRTREYSDDDRNVALAFYDATGSVAKASRKSGIPEKVIRYWIDGGTIDSDDIRRAQGLGNRPLPPAELTNDLRYPEAFTPAPDVAAWAIATFCTPGNGPLYNPEHTHLTQARIGMLWTNTPNVKQMRSVAGTAEIPYIQGGKWVKARMEYQLAQWFGSVPDFLITLDAVTAAQMTDATFCALVEHELYHCAQARDDYGAPRFTRDGDPKFAIRGHDAEEFVGVVRRYGVGNAAGGVAELVKAAQREPLIAAADIEYACGTCGVKVA